MGAAALVLFAAPTAQADAGAVLRDIRKQLSSYGEQEEVGLTALRELGPIAKQEDADQSDEARFLRAAIAADLYFLADYREDAALEDRLAHAFGVAPVALPVAIAQSLAGSDRGVFAAPAARVRALLGVALADDAQGERAAAGFLPGDDPVVAALTLRDAAQTASTREAGPDAYANLVLGLATGPQAGDRGRVDDSQHNELAVAGKRTEDSADGKVSPAEINAKLTQSAQPDATAAVVERPNDDARLAPGSQALLSGLRALAAAFARVRDASAHADPLANALLPVVQNHLGTLSRAWLPLAEQLSPEHVPAAFGVAAEPVVPSTIAQVTATGVDVGTAPRAALTAAGEVQLERDAATWPNTTRLALEERHWDLPRYYRTVEKVVAPLCGADKHGTVGILAASHARTETFTGLLRGLRRAGCTSIVLLARDAEDMPVGLPLQVSVRVPDVEGVPIHVRVTPHGATVERHGLETTCGYTRDADGARQLELDRLTELAAKRHAASEGQVPILMSYVGWSRLKDVTDALWHIAEPSRPVDIVLP